MTFGQMRLPVREDRMKNNDWRTKKSVRVVTRDGLQKRALYLVGQWQAEANHSNNATLRSCAKQLRRLLTASSAIVSRCAR